MYSLISRLSIIKYLLILVLLLSSNAIVLASDSLTQDDIDAIYGNTIFFDNEDSCITSGDGGVNLTEPGSLYVIGDSITNGAANDIKNLFPNGVAVVNGVDGRRTNKAAEVINGEDSLAVSLAQVVVIALGTNDGGGDISNSIKSAVDAVRTVNSNASIYWVDVAALQPSSTLNAVNQHIYSSSSINDYSVLSWFKTVFPGQEPTDPDADLNDVNSYINTADGYDVHPVRGEGMKAFANTIYTGVSRSISPAVSSSSTTGDDNSAKAFYYFVMHGLTAEQAAGVLGNLMRESGENINPSRREVGQGGADGLIDPRDITSGGYGIAQWTGDNNRQALAEFADITNRPYNDLTMQLDFIWYDLTRTPSDIDINVAGRAYSGSSFYGYDELLQTTTVRDATVVFANKYERSSAEKEVRTGIKTIDEAYGERLDYADKAYAKYAGSISVNEDCDGLVGGLAERVVQVALREAAAGAKISDGSSHKYTDGPSSAAWCAYFVSWVYREAGFPLGGVDGWKISAVSHMLSEAQARNQFHSKESGYQPQPGDIAIYKNGVSRFESHVNIVISSTPTDYQYVGGNERGVVEDGTIEKGTVQQGSHMLNAADLTGFWTPA